METCKPEVAKRRAVLRAAIWGAALSMVIPAVGLFFHWLGGPPPQWLVGVAVTLELPALLLMQGLGVNSGLVMLAMQIAIPALAFALIAAVWQFAIKAEAPVTEKRTEAEKKEL